MGTKENSMYCSWWKLILWLFLIKLMLVEQQKRRLSLGKLYLRIFTPVHSISWRLPKRAGYHRFEMNGSVACIPWSASRSQCRLKQFTCKIGRWRQHLYRVSRSFLGYRSYGFSESGISAVRMREPTDTVQLLFILSVYVTCTKKWFSYK